MKGSPVRVARGARRAVSTVVRLPQRTVAWSRRKPRAAAVVSGLLAVILLAATATFTVLHLREERITQARASATAAAQHAVPVLLSYDHKTLARETKTRVGMLTGSFKADYAKLMRDVVLPSAKKSALITTSTVVSAGVEPDATPDRVTLLMFVNQSTGSEGKPPSKAGSRVRVTMERPADDWLVSSLKPI